MLRATPDLNLWPRILATLIGPNCDIVDMGAYEFGTACEQDPQCDDQYVCTDDTCLDEGVCELQCFVILYGDVNWSGGLVDKVDIQIVLDCFGQKCSECVGGTYHGCDIYSSTPLGCGSDDVVNLDDIIAVLEASKENYLCPHPCGSCATCAISQPEGSSQGDPLAEAGDALVLFLTTRTPVNEQRFRGGVMILTHWLVEHMSGDHRAGLAERLQDPSLEFASPVGEAMVPQIVTRFLEE